MIEIIKPDFEFEDDRGKLTQLVREGYSQVNVIFSKSGVVRGGHYHKINKEAFFVVNGKCIVKARNAGIEEQHTFKSGDMFVIPEFTSHDFIYEEDTTLVSLYSRGVELENGQMDIFTEE